MRYGGAAALMYVEFYIDQFFLEHFLTGALLLAATASLEKARVPWGRIAAGSLANAALTTLLLYVGLPGWNVWGIILAGGITFFNKKRSHLVKSLALLLLVTVCFGGAMEALLSLWGFPLMAGTVLAVLFVLAAGKKLERLMKLDGTVKVRLRWKERTVEVRGLIDSGNHLREPFTGRPVSIIDADIAGKLLGEAWEGQKGFLLIPYHSIGTEEGWLQGVTIDRMYVLASGKEAVIEGPVLAIYRGHISAGARYQMILHPLHTR